MIALLELFRCQHGNTLSELNIVFATSDSSMDSALHCCVSSPSILLLFLTSPSFPFLFIFEIAGLESILRDYICVAHMVQWQCFGNS